MRRLSDITNGFSAWLDHLDEDRPTAAACVAAVCVFVMLIATHALIVLLGGCLGGAA